MKPLLDDAHLERSQVVANASMNRERGITGVNSYAKDLAFDPLAFLTGRLETQDGASWLDLCCGTGNALIQASTHFHEAGLGARITLMGVDLVPMFHTIPSEIDFLHLQAASLSHWEPDRRFDLITCVHGLHYIGDKLGLLQRAVSWLAPEGLFIGHLDLANVRIGEAPEATRDLRKVLSRAGFKYDGKRRILSRQGGESLSLPYRYLGADDRAGPNFSHQPVVDSYYDPSAS